MSKRFNGLLRAGVLSLALSFATHCLRADSVVRAHDLTMARGATNTLLVSLEGVGNENALGFTLCYDTNQLVLLPPVIRGAAVSNLFPTATFTSDPTATESNGWVGVFIGLDAGMGEAWPAGTNFLVEVPFQAATGTGSATTIVAFCDSVITRALTDAGSNVLAASFINASVILHGTCAYQLSTSLITVPSTGSSNSVSITTDSNCGWTVENTNSWITIVGDAGTGSGNIGVSVAPNSSLEPRVGTLTIAGQLLTVNQEAIVCSYSLAPTNNAHGHGVESNSFNIIAPTECAWTATTTNNWISLVSGTNGSGDGTVGYLLAANPDNAPRSGAITVGDATFFVSQSAAPCDAILTPTNFIHGSGSETGIVSVTIPNGCAWEVMNTNSWIVIDFGATGNGNGSVGYSVTENLSSLSRSGTLVIGGVPFTVTQAGAACVFSISPTNEVAPYFGATNIVTVTTISDCAWTISNLVSWITFPNGTNGIGTQTNIYHVEANTVPLARTGVVMVAGEVLTVIQDAAPCNFSVAPLQASFTANAATGTVAVTTPSACRWTTETTNDWLTILSSSTNTGSAEVSYAVAENFLLTERVGSIVVAEQTLIVTQQATICSYALSPAGFAHGSGTETGFVAVTTGINCPWQASTTNSWIALTAATNGVGNGGIAYSINPNPTALPRSGVIRIEGQDFTITQSGAACSFELATNSATHSASAESNSVALTTLVGCSWAVSNGTPWITILSSINNSNSGVVSYSVATNPTALLRSGVLNIGGEIFTVTQRGAECSFALSANSASHTARTETNSVALTTLEGCEWSISKNAVWIEILSPINNTSSGNVTYRVLTNTTALSRTGIVSIANQSFIVTQSGAECSFQLSSNNVSHDAGSETGSVAVATLVGCTWDVVNSNSWIQIASPTNNTGSGDVTYILLANETAIPRTGTVSIAGQTLQVAQTGVSCTFALASAEAAHGSGSETGSVAVITPSGCTWSVSNSMPWITILPPLNHSSGESFNYVVDANPTALSRTGIVSVAEQSFKIVQSGAACTFTLSATNAIHGAGLTNGSVSLTTLIGCSWNVANTNQWLTILSGTNYINTGTVLYSVDANPTALARTGVVSIQSQDFTVTQTGADCTFTIVPENASYDFAAATGSVAVTTLVGCQWNVSSGASWITILSSLNNTNGGSVAYRVAANPTALSRTGTVSIAGQNFAVTQSGAACSFALATNAAVHGFGLETNSVAVSTLVGCTWSISNGTPWIQILSSLINTNSTNVSYRVLANPDALWRTGVVSIAGIDFAIAQSPATCTFALATNNASHSANAITNSVALTTLVGCTWAVSNGTPWIHILSSVANSNSGSVTYSVEANPTALTRSGIVRIAELDFTITQAGADCSFDLDSFSAAHGAGPENNLVQVTTLVGCAWSVSNVPPWIVINTPLNNTNSGPVSYSVTANATAIPRSTIIKIAGQDFAIEQDGAGCDFTLATNNATHTAGAATNSVGVTTLLGCSWTVENSNSWIIIQTPLNNTNDGVVTYRVLTNTTALTRVGVIKIAQRNFTVTQSGANCTFALETNSASFNFTSATGSVGVTTLSGCTWSISNGIPWITILSSLNNSNSGTVSYSVQSNSTALLRTGVVNIAGQNLTVTQFGAPCSFALATNNATHTPAPQTNSVVVTTLVGCTWSPSNGTPWITILSPLNNTNSGVLAYSVATNPTALLRTGVINVQGQNFTVTQNGTTCSFALSSNSAAFGFAAGNGSVAVSTVDGCTWPVSNGTPWITLLSPSNNTSSGTVSFNVQSNSTALPRSAVISIAGQSFTVTQDGAPCSFALSASGAVVGSTSVVSSVSVTTLVGCAWSVSSGAPWIQILSNFSNTNSGVVNYSVQSNSTALWRTGVVSIAGQNFTIAQQGAPCSFELTSLGAIHGPNGESNSVAVATLAGCSWSISNGTPWITILSSLNNSNSGNVNYTVQSNSTALWRTGIVNIAGQNFTVAQSGAACSFVIASNSAAHDSGMVTNSVGVETLAGCVWNVSNSTPWITIQSPLNNTSSATVIYSVASNLSVFARTGVVNIAGQDFTVTQAAGLSCSLALQSSNWMHRAVVEPGFIGVLGLPECSWGVTNTNSWVTIASGPTVNGGGHVRYWLSANTNAEPRSAIINVGNIDFALTQAGTACTYRLSTTNRSHGSGATANSFTVTTGSSCSWNVINTNDWITISSNPTGTGTLTVAYSITKNNGTTPRYAQINVGGEILLLAQWGSGCGFSVNPLMRTHGSGQENGSASFSVNPNAGTCAWAVSNTTTWITNISPTSGTGAGSFTYTVLANPSGAPRVGVFTVGGATYVVNQLGAPCSYSVTPTNIVHSGTAETGTVAVVTGTGCPWNVINPNSWISITAQGATNLSYSLQANPTAYARTGVVNVAGQNVVIVQNGATCTYSLATNFVSHGFNTESGSVALNTLVGCPWDAATTENWITITSLAHNTGSAVVSYIVATNPAVTGRTGYITIADKTLQVAQAGSPCAFSISADSASHAAEAEAGAVNVITDPLCSWLVENTNAWIIVTNGGTGSRTINYSILANPSFNPRSGFIVIAGHPFAVTQAPKPCTYVLSPTSISHGAAGTSGSISVTASNECSWQVSNSNSWITITSATAGSGTGTVDYNVATNSGSYRIGDIFIAGIPFRISQAGSVRTVRALNMNVQRGQTNRVLIALESTGVENALGFSLCFDTNLLSFVDAVRGSDAASASLNVNAATNFPGQVGVALGLGANRVFPAGSNIVAEVLFRAAAGTTFTNTLVQLCDSPVLREISDAAAHAVSANYTSAVVNILGNCTYALNTNAVSIVANGGNSSVVVASQNGCSWTAVSSNSWIVITSGPSGTGSGPVNFTVAPNPSGISRVGTMIIAGITCTVTQSGQPCVYTLSTNVQSHTAAFEAGLMQVTSTNGCPWSVINTNPWVLITSLTNNSGSADVTYNVQSNTVAISRSAIVTIAGQMFTINQAPAPCFFAISATNKVHGFISETGLVSVTSATGCAWTVDNTNSWILITSNTNGAGDGSVSYAVDYNPSNVGRTGVVTIAMQRLTISQPGNPCPVTLSPASRGHSENAETNSFNVTNVTACAWTVSNTNSWIITSTNNGTGNATITYRVTPNPTLASRTGIIRVSGREFTVTQAAATCLYGISPTSQTNGYTVQTGAVVVATFSDCDWAVQNTNAWITFTFVSGRGSANLYYTVTNNPGSVVRTGVVIIANQPFTVVQDGAPCSFTLTPPSASYPFSGQTNTISVATLTGCVWTASTADSWIGFQGLTSRTNNGTLTYTVVSNATSLTRTGTVNISGQPFTIVQSGVPCVATLSPTNRAHSSHIATTGTFSVTAPIGCGWNATTTNNWVTFNGASGNGNGTVTYLLEANPLPFGRTGTVDVLGKIFTVSQPAAPCNYQLSQNNVLESAGGSEAKTVYLTTLAACPWNIVNTNTWLIAVAANGEANGVGSGDIYYLLDPNPTSIARTGNVRIADQVLTIRQSGLPCNFSLSTNTATAGSAGATNTVTINAAAGCSWTVGNTNNWITFPNGTNYSGGGAITYWVSTHSLALDRTGIVTIAGQTFTVNQLGITCTYSNSPASSTLGSGNVTGLVSVATSGGCSWVVVNTNGWIAIKSGAAGTNGGLVRFTVQANPSPSVRSAYLTVAGNPFLVTQLGSPCSYTLSSTGRLHGSLYETGQVTVLTDTECGWDVTTADNWIHFTSATNGVGTAAISYSVDANTAFGDRTGHFTIGGELYTVTQLGAACTYTFQTNGAMHGALTETGMVYVTMPLGCNYSLSASNSWITILSNSVSSNSGTIKYSVSPNVSGAQRLGFILVGGQSFAVTQATVFCSFTVAPTNVLHGFEAETGLISVNTSNPCPWTVLETNTWITINGGTNYTGSNSVSYSITANPNSSSRTGLVTIAGKIVSIRQAGLVCSYDVTPTNQTHGFLATTGQVTLLSPTLCSWSVSKSNSWITILTPTNNNVGPATVSYSLLRNDSATPRSSVITIGGKPYTVTQNGAPFLIASNKTLSCTADWSFDPPLPAGNCGTPGSTVVVLSTMTNFGCGRSYVATRVWSATDACTNQVFATQIVTVVSAPPLMFCAPSKTVECNSGWTFDLPSAIEFCGGTNVTIRVPFPDTITTNGLCGSTRIITRTWEAVDSCSKTSSCSQTVFVVDTTPPVVNAPANKTVECGSPWTFDLPTATDACSGTNVSIRAFSTITNNLDGCSFTVTRVWEIFDPCTNRATCAQTITVVDTTPPTLNCATNKTVEYGNPWSFDQPSATDNCSLAPFIVIQETVTNRVGRCGNTFAATCTWVAFDDCGNSRACSQTVTVIDTTPPTATCPSGKTVEYGSAWDFDLPTGTDLGSGTNLTVRAVSTTTNTAGFCGPTFITTRIWEISDACSNKVNCSQTVYVRDTTPPAITCATNKNINCLAAWSFDTPSAFDIGSGTNLTITILSSVTNGTCGSGYSATRTWRVTDGCNNSAVCSQTVFGRGIVNISGTVFCPTNYPATVSDKRLPGAMLTGPTNTTALSGSDGTYSLVFDAASNVTVNALPPSGEPTDGVTTLDIAVVRRHILSSGNLDTPYKLLAADVDGNNKITTVDLSYIRRFILDATNIPPAGLWRFVPADFVFSNPLAPWDPPTNRNYSSVSVDIPGQDFIAIKLGDVNNSMGSGGSAGGTSKAKKDFTSVVTFQVNSAVSRPATSVVVRVTVRDFARVTTAQGTLAWDPTVLRFAGTQQHGLDGLGPANFGTNRVSFGKLSFSWDDPVMQGVSVPDDTVIFALRFDVIGNSGSSSPVTFADSPTVCEASVAWVACTFGRVDGMVSVTDSSASESAPMRLSASSLTNNTFGVAVPTVIGKTYILEYTDSLPTNHWTPLPGVPGDGTVKILSDPSPKTEQRFYRLKVE